MNEQKAREILGAMFMGPTENNELYSPYSNESMVIWKPNQPHWIDLPELGMGWSLPELKAITWWMENKKDG